MESCSDEGSKKVSEPTKEKEEEAANNKKSDEPSVTLASVTTPVAEEPSSKPHALTCSCDILFPETTDEGQPPAKKPRLTVENSVEDKQVETSMATTKEEASTPSMTPEDDGEDMSSSMPAVGGTYLPFSGGLSAPIIGLGNHPLPNRFFATSYTSPAGPMQQCYS